MDAGTLGVLIFVGIVALIMLSRTVFGVAINKLVQQFPILRWGIIGLGAALIATRLSFGTITFLVLAVLVALLVAHRMGKLQSVLTQLDDGLLAAFGVRPEPAEDSANAPVDPLRHSSFTNNEPPESGTPGTTRPGA